MYKTLYVDSVADRSEQFEKVPIYLNIVLFINRSERFYIVLFIKRSERFGTVLIYLYIVLFIKRSERFGTVPIYLYIRFY